MARTPLPTDIVTGPVSEGGTASHVPHTERVHERVNDLYDVRDWGTTGTSDDTAVFQAAHDEISSLGGGTLKVPRGRFFIAGLELKQGVGTEGSGLGANATNYGTQLKLPDGADTDIITTPGGVVGGLHGCFMRYLNLHGNKANNSAGNCFNPQDEMNEGSIIESCVIHSASEHGLYQNKGAQPLYYRDLHVFSCDGAGVKFEQTESPTAALAFTDVCLDFISGDDNADGLIVFDGHNRGFFGVTIRGVKSEAGTTTQLNGIVLHDTAGSVFVIDGVYHGGPQSGGPSGAAIRIESGTASRVLWSGVTANSDASYLVDDDINGFQLTAAVAGAASAGSNFTPHFMKGLQIRGDGSGSALLGGASLDVNLYRGAANMWKTDDKFVATAGLGAGNSAAATSLGSVTKKLEVFDASGASLGFLPIYDAIT